MEKFDNQNIEQDSYKTGSTKPPKNRGGLVAGLLIAVILLAGVSSILGVMNIQLFRMLQTEENESVSFAPSQTEKTTVAQEISGVPSLGLTGDGIDELDQRFFGLPAGVLISQINENGIAAKAGIAAGDIILSVNGVAVADAQSLEETLKNCKSGEQVKMVVYRYRTGMEYMASVVLD